MKMPSLSVSMIVKNEECFLEECLNSVKNVADEIVIVDTGSTDNTVLIAEKFGAHIFHYEWNSDFSAARNFALSKTTGDWALYIDADEKIAPESIKEIEKIKTSKDKKGYFCTVKSLDSGNNRDNSMRYVRLFRNIQGAEFRGKVHEQISASLKENGVELADSDILIIHEGYNISEEEKRKKAERNLSLLIKEYEKNKSDYYAFQLACTYSILNDREKSAKYYKIAAKSNILSKSIRAESYSSLALNALKAYNPAAAGEYIAESIELNREQPFSYLLAAKIYLQKGDTLKAEELCKKAFQLNKRIIKEGSRKELQIYLEEEEIICFGLFLSLKGKKKEGFNNYLNEYKELLDKGGKYSGKNALILIDKILINNNLDEKEENLLLKLINKNSSDFYYQVIESTLNSLSENFMEKLYKKFPASPDIIKLYSLYCFSKKKIEKAIGAFEEKKEIITKDPPSIIYLISYHIALGEKDKAGKWIEYLEDNFGMIEQFMPVIKKLRMKIFD